MQTGMPGRAGGTVLLCRFGVTVEGRLSCARPAPRLRTGRPVIVTASAKDRAIDHREECLYETLGVSPGASKEALKRAYRHLALRHHPDVDRSPDAHTKFQRIREAYETLLAGGGEKQRPWWRSRWTEQLRGLGKRSGEVVHTRVRRKPPACTPDPTQQTPAAAAETSGEEELRRAAAGTAGPSSAAQSAWAGSDAHDAFPGNHHSTASGSGAAAPPEEEYTMSYEEMLAHRERVSAQMQRLKERSSRRASRNGARRSASHAAEAAEHTGGNASAASSHAAKAARARAERESEGAPAPADSARR